METNNNIQDRIEATLQSLDNLNDVKAPSFFKDRTLQHLFSEKEEVVSSSIFNWFSPQLQLATLVCVLAINVYVITQIKSSSYNESISNFASDYGISTESNSSIISL